MYWKIVRAVCVHLCLRLCISLCVCFCCDMDLFSDDDFEINDDEQEMPATPVAGCNPVKEHLMKQLSDVESRIETTGAEIEETELTIDQSLKKLHFVELYGEVLSSDSDCDFYTIECVPVQKARKLNKTTAKQILVVKECWKQVTPLDKWVIGVCLENTSTETLKDLQFYVNVEEEGEISGTTTFWSRNSRTSWQKTDVIGRKSDAIATVALDLPKFDGNPSCKVLGTISYRADDKLYQTPVPTTYLSAEETVDASCALNLKAHAPWAILTLKSIAIEKTVGIDTVGDPTKAAGVLKLLGRLNFREICDDVYVVEATGTLMHCLVEILPSMENEALIKIFSRSVAQMNIMLRLLREEFSDIIDKEADTNVDAVKVLVEEIETYLHGDSTLEKQKARVKTDLLIP